MTGDARKFLDTGAELSGREQLEFMRYVLADFSLDVPRLNRSQQTAISKNAELHPTRRLFPPALGNFVFRKGFLTPKPDSEAAPLVAEHMKQDVWLPTDSDLPADNNGKPWGNHNWRNLWRDGVKRVVSINKYDLTPQQLRDGVEPEIKTYALRYKTPHGKMWARRGYLKSLLESGDAIYDSDAKLTWTFPFLDVDHAKPDGVYKSPEPIYDELNYIVSPEALLTAQALRIIAGRPLHPDITHIANEAVTEISTYNEVVALRGVTGVTRNAERGYLRQSWWTMKPMPDWQAANGTSGLS